jgi:hypothetical protein
VPSDTPCEAESEIAVPLAEDSIEEDEEENRTSVLYCTGRFSEEHNNREEWILCAKYFRWAHILCAGTQESLVRELSGLNTFLHILLPFPL